MQDGPIRAGLLGVAHFAPALLLQRSRLHETRSQSKESFKPDKLMERRLETLPRSKWSARYLSVQGGLIDGISSCGQAFGARSWVNQNRLLQFQVSPEAGSQMGQEFRVREASLWLKADLLKAPTSKCRSTDIFQFDRLTAEPIAVPLEEAASGWQKIDVTQTVSEWLGERAKDKLSLFVDCSCCAHWRIHLFNEESDQRSNPNRPFLVIHTDPSTAKRVRRRAIDCSLDSGNQCCKQRFYVSFKALGWEDWVIAPQGYFANYCRGDCGQHRTPDTFVTYHTHVIEEVRKTQHLSGMTPCCAPLKFSTMSLIYYGPESTIIKRDLPKMVVEECGCP
ncbi:hypothetical protein HUJ04_000021 [Dendroctonus ponderosae]|nr:hypothetical protein HUJ04_000021 [Dendroctonus ponderosae]